MSRALGWFKRWRARGHPPEEKSSPGPAHIHVRRLVFSDGTQVPLEQNSILLLTGPNNVGKSSCLREIRDYLLEARRPRPVLSEIAVALHGGLDDFKTAIAELGVRDAGGGIVKIYTREYHLDRIERDYEEHFIGSIPMLFFVAYLGAAERLALTEPVRRGDYLRNAPDSPLQWLELDEDAESRVSSIFRRTFGSEIVLNTLAGDSLVLHVASCDEERPTTAKDYSRWLGTKPMLHRQGDGMRSFIGTMLSLLVHPRNIVLIDEPEAFMHPPQARRLAEVIATETSNNSQVIVATHNDELVRALLDASGDRVTVARITREGDQNAVTVLRSEQIVELWTDPILRTSDVLSALFHDVAILCEGESDARFLRSMLDATRTDVRDPDARIYHFGGKDRLASIAASLRALAVPVVAVVDIDVLSDKGKFLSLYHAMGGSDPTVERDVQTLIASVGARKGQLTGSELSVELKRVAVEIDGTLEVPKNMRNELTRLIRAGSNWGRVKEDGYRAFVEAPAIQAYERVKSAGGAVGLLINPEGELEGFCRQDSRARKSEWLTAVLSRDLANDLALEEGRIFVARIRDAMKCVLQRPTGRQSRT